MDKTENLQRISRGLQWENKPPKLKRSITNNKQSAVLPTFRALIIVAVATRHRVQSKSNVPVAWLAGARADLLNGLANQDSILPKTGAYL